MSRFKGGINNAISSREYYGLNNSQDIYKGTSFKFSGEWAPGVHYFNDEYIIDFVTYDGKLWVCSRNHLSSITFETNAESPVGNYPSETSRYWDLVFSGSVGKDGLTPTIGDNGNWFIGSEDTNISASGTKGDKGDKGEQGLQGERGEPGPKGDKGETGTFDQNVTFNELNTNNKSIIGAINELLELISSKDPSEPTPDITNMMYYGYIPYSVTGDIAEYTDITLNMLQHSDSFIVKEEPKTKDKTSIGSVPEACFIIVAIPASYGLTAKKDSGMGDRVQFSESDFGCNGASVIYNNVEYYLFGEITLVAGERFIYIE